MLCLPVLSIVTALESGQPRDSARAGGSVGKLWGLPARFCENQGYPRGQYCFVGSPVLRFRVPLCHISAFPHPGCHPAPRHCPSRVLEKEKGVHKMEMG